MTGRMISVLTAAALALSGCIGGRDYATPREQDNACAILADRGEWGEALSETAHRWGAPPHVVMAIIWKESSFRATAKTPRTYTFFGLIPTGRQSTAYGYSQALDGTWGWYKEETGNGWADRDDFEDSVDFIGWYMAKTRRSNGLAMDDAYSQYIAYHQGHTGYRRGGWKSNDWLKGAAGRVARQAALYERQLAGCRSVLS